MNVVKRRPKRHKSGATGQTKFYGNHKTVVRVFLYVYVFAWKFVALCVGQTAPVFFVPSSQPLINSSTVLCAEAIKFTLCHSAFEVPLRWVMGESIKWELM